MLPGSEFMTFLRVNLVDREPSGTVPAERYQSTLTSLCEDILELVNPDTGRPAAAEVLLPGELFHGECSDVLPDLIIRWKNDSPIRALESPVQGRIDQGLEFIQNTHSSHTGQGLAVIAGPGIPQGVIEEARPLQDLTATFYTLLGATPPEHLEGEPICLTDAKKV
jgi:predicted AlkP superfamily phosphohydrolase/phosphomutase